MENYGHESLGTQIDGMNFQTHFRACLKKAFCKIRCNIAVSGQEAVWHKRRKLYAVY